MRPEYLLAGCILVGAGLILALIGYDKTQDTMLERVVSFAQAVSGQPAPPGLVRSKSTGYLMLLGGAGAFGVGLTLIMKSGQSNK